MKTKKIIISRDDWFDESATWDWKEKDVDEQDIVHHEESEISANEEEREEDSSPATTTPSSPSSSTNGSTSTPRKMKDLNDVYARCNFCILEPENFEEANQDKDWRNAMEEHIQAIGKSKTWKL